MQVWVLEVDEWLGRPEVLNVEPLMLHDAESRNVWCALGILQRESLIPSRLHVPWYKAYTSK